MGNAVSTSGGPVPALASLSANNRQSGGGSAGTGTATAGYGGGAAAADSFLGELGGQVQYDKSLGTSRFLKTIRGRHKQGALVVKVFVKHDPALSLKAFHRRVKAEREALAGCPNALPYARAIETERAGYLIRQWAFSNLYDRISTRPFLSVVEKKWIAFQLLTGLKHARERGVAHGDIKTENIAVTSWNWVYLTDFSASFKPTVLPLDDPSTFSFYFDTSSRRSCYLAPERFYSAASSSAAGSSKGNGTSKVAVTEAMDVFALGCVLAELWMEGTPPFTLSQMFKYREGQYSPDAYLAEIEDEAVRTLIRSMISLDPQDRHSFAHYLNSSRHFIFPDIFYTFLHPFTASLNNCSSASAHSVSAPVPSSAAGANGLIGASPGTGDAAQTTTLRSDADERIERLWTEWEMVDEYLGRDARIRRGGGVHDAGDAREGLEEHITKEAKDSDCDGDEHSLFPIRLHLPGLEGRAVESEETEDGPALIVLSLVCANLRNCIRPASIVRALDMMLALLRYLTDETKLDRLVPYVVTLLQDDMAFVRSAALKTLTQTLLLVKTISPSNASVFPEYILPNTRPLATDPEILPRATYAQCIAALAQQARKVLDMTEAMKTEGTFSLAGANMHDFAGAGSPFLENYDARLQELQLQIQDHVGPLLSDSSPIVKRALLYHVGSLCSFFGPLKANDAILAHLVTYLNTRDWQLRAAWNENAVEVASCVGSRSLEEYILPLISLSLADSEEFVIVRTLATLTALTERRFLTRGKTWELVSQVTGFLCHPNIWIREGTAAFLTSTAKRLNSTDCWCILYPTIKRLLRADVKDITELSLLDNAREPLSRVIFEAAVAWAGRASRSNFWSPARASAKGAPRDAGVRTDDDHAQLEKLRQLGMKPEDEFKLGMMRDYISKLAVARQANAPARISDANDSLSQPGGIVLADLGVVPQTIFFSVRSADELSRLAQDNQPQSQKRVSSFSRRISLDTPTSNLSRVTMSRNVSVQPIEDLRRRLALNKGGGGSTTSLSTANEAAPSESAASASVEPGDLHRANSASSTTLSDATTSTRGAEIVQPVPRSRVHQNAVEVGRAGAAVAEDTVNAAGLFEVESRYRNAAGEDVLSEMTNAVRTPGAANKSIAGQRFVTTYDGNDPSIKHLLERVYLDTYRGPLPELGPHIAVGIPRRRALRTSFPPRERTPSRPTGTLIAHLIEHTAAIVDIAVAPDQLFFVTGSEDGTVKVWDTIRLEKNVTSRSRQTLQQGGKITSVCMIENSHCIASASNNGTLCIHRVDVSLSGSMPRYGKPQLIRQQNAEKPGDFVMCLASYNTDKATNLVFGTSLSSIVVLDIRTMRNQHVFENPPHFGPITCLCIDRKRVWLVAGTASGTLSLWDLRFGLLLRSWSAGTRRVQKVAVHPTQGKGRWIVVSIEDGGGTESGGNPSVSKQHGSNVVDVWDIDRGQRVEEYRVASQRSAGGSSRRDSTVGTAAQEQVDSPAIINEATLDPAAAIEALLASVEANSPKARSQLALPSIDAPATTSTTLAASHLSRRPGVRTFLIGSDYAMQVDARPTTAAPTRSNVDPTELADGKRETAYLLTAGEDRQLRFWDLGKISKSTVFSGRDIEDEAPTYSAHTSSGRPALFLESAAPARSSRPGSSTSASGSGHRVHRSTLIANSQQQLLRGHQEAVTALAVIDLPFRCVVSGDRSGVVKVFE